MTWTARTLFTSRVISNFSTFSSSCLTMTKHLGKVGWLKTIIWRSILKRKPIKRANTIGVSTNWAKIHSLEKSTKLRVESIIWMIQSDNRKLIISEPIIGDWFVCYLMLNRQNCTNNHIDLNGIVYYSYLAVDGIERLESRDGFRSSDALLQNRHFRWKVRFVVGTIFLLIGRRQQVARNGSCHSLRGATFDRTLV